ncbi:MAG: citrate lyase holo-[acyl-carrier protein] synthase [Lachnospiraceae bacterium]|nr:citrate lyase holo-[acyl-carrier protein] synthase [Lachnospiraceae bacterium]
MVSEVTLQEILAFQEKKAAYLATMQRQYTNCIVVCLGLNIAGPRKTDDDILYAFKEGCKAIEKVMVEKKLQCIQAKTFRDKAGYAKVYTITQSNMSSVKKEMIHIEEEHELGRLFDIDVYGMGGLGIHRKELGMPPRRCLLCKKEARVCMENRTHSVQELEKVTHEMISRYKGVRGE